jgi:putative hydrolase of the HAD superfamily
VNIVFDLGGVVVAWKPDDIVSRAFADPRERQLARREIIGHRDWLALDRGDLSVDDVVKRGAERTGLSESSLRLLIDAVPPSLVPDVDVINLLHRLKANGNTLYCLSNMPKLSIEHLERAHSFWHLFDGIVISSRVGFCKPEPEIYAHLLAAHALRPAETIFVDDVIANLQAAERFDIRTIHFRSAAQCAAELKRLGSL